MEEAILWDGDGNDPESILWDGDEAESVLWVTDATTESPTCANPNEMPCAQLQAYKCSAVLSMAQGVACNTPVVTVTTKSGKSESYDFTSYFRNVREFVAWVDKHCDGNSTRRSGGVGLVSRCTQSRPRIISTGL